MRTTATKQRRERPRAVKMSLQFSRVLTTPACIAALLHEDSAVGRFGPHFS